MAPKNSLFGKIPFLRFTFSFILGNILSEYFEFKYPILLLIIITIWIVSTSFFNRFKNVSLSIKIQSITVVLVFIILGYIYSSTYKNHQFSNHLPTKAIYTGTVLSKTQTTTNKVKYEIKIRSAAVNDSLIKTKEKIHLFSSDSLTNREILSGSNILFNTKLYPIRNNNNPGEFRYSNFMKNRGIRYQSYVFKDIEILSNESNSLQTVAHRLRSNLLEKYKMAGIPEREFAVLSALTLGEKSYLDKNLKSKFSTTGAMHVLAVSGLHVGILYVVLNFFLGFLRKRKHTRILNTIVLIITLWSFAFITGLSPSVMRACTMFSFIVIGENLKRKTNIYNTLSLSAFILMLINPLIIYEVGFQLSYAAVTSIVFFHAKIFNLIKIENKILKYLWRLFSVSVAAQLGTFPISIYYFHQFPIYFWLSNFIVIPAAAVLIYLAICFFLVQSVPLLLSFFSWCLITSTKIMNNGIDFIDQLPYAAIENIWIDKITMLLLLACIALIAVISLAPKIRLLIITNMLLILLVANAIINRIQTKQQSFVVFYKSYNGDLLSIINGSEHYYYSINKTLNEFQLNLVANTSGLYHTNKAVLIDSCTQNNIRKIDNYILFKNLSIYINMQNENEKMNPIETDLIWHSYNSKIKIKNYDSFNVRTYKKGKLKPFSLKNDESFINTRNNGALLFFLNNQKS